MDFDKLQVMQSAWHLHSQTIQDLKDSLAAEDNLQVLQTALTLVESGSGYGTGKTAGKMIQARIRRLEKQQTEPEKSND